MSIKLLHFFSQRLPDTQTRLHRIHVKKVQYKETGELKTKHPRLGLKVVCAFTKFPNSLYGGEKGGGWDPTPNF